jgi:hypothetical protein
MLAQHHQANVSVRPRLSIHPGHGQLSQRLLQRMPCPAALSGFLIRGFETELVEILAAGLPG